ncbi:hypothetical protein DICPUDRAFT_155910 [Dictyostelium purpureum]|uniref:Uncharacterized protein n=1 Tax=Dictyostelium purpureum TaxID=5786 RepID=F0ZV73_DICPU|nr:uncharacterized protein DICPUDRAFT_155910 [Dictyostelium purpureum]EGC32144.1 hypothetical protein DICPUDRAFT_155910 [Dictyostelium purpureum]|eukprot:XP_003291316.1 hypothetical protein DICPUDRAFT_155910 [Dictyostelium purpureum]
MSILSNLIRFQNINNSNNSKIICNNINTNFGLNKITTDVDLDYSHFGGIGNLTNHIHASISKGLLHTL